jgi:hypothetical protein
MPDVKITVVTRFAIEFRHAAGMTMHRSSCKIWGRPFGAAYNAWVTPPNASPALILEDRATGEFFISACQL